jgi:carboxyl-terminal processing protease
MLLQTQSPKGYIIDLRDNPGGYLDAAVNILGHFVTEGNVVVSTKSADNVTDDYKSAGSGELSKLPVVVLINDNTASAAEILAGAIQDYKIGQLVGTKSFGKGSVQEIRNYPDNSLLKISIAHWLTPLNRDINEVGLTPDVTADLQQQDLFNGKDTQLDKAISIISSH